VNTGQRTHRNQYPAVMAAPIVGENSIGMRLAWRSFQAVIRRSASSSTWASVARRLAAFFSGAVRLILHFAAVEAHGCSIAAPLCQANMRKLFSEWAGPAIIRPSRAAPVALDRSTPPSPLQFGATL
jgi:hypothetical protein